jgi:hypothetical protein
MSCSQVLTKTTVPPQAKWLTAKEEEFIRAQLPKNGPRDSESNFSFREIIVFLRNTKMWLFTFCWAFFIVGTLGLSFQLVVENLGFTFVSSFSKALLIY